MRIIKSCLAAIIVLSSNHINADVPVKIISSDKNGMVVEIGAPDYVLNSVTTPRGTEYKINLKDGSSLLQKGNPDIAKFSIPVQLPVGMEMTAQIISANYNDVQNISLAPSKGTISRADNPSDIPFNYSTVYIQNTFFPSQSINLSSSYFIRNIKGQNLLVCPFQYNPVTKTLRVYNKTQIRLTYIKNNSNSSSLNFEDDKEFTHVYQQHFLNYSLANSASKVNYTPVNEDGDMLVICYDAFAPKMTPLVEWKNLKGIKTTMVLKSTINASATPAQIKAYITNFIATNPNLKYVLLVGDHQQIPASATTAGPSDNEYTYLAGNDHYPDIFIGRFSAQTATEVEIQVNKVLNYEKYPQLNGSFYNTGACIASNQGPGDNNEYDYQHQQVIRGKLQAFTYGTVGEFYDGSQGGADAPGNPTALDVQNFINANGAGIISYTGHGGDFSFVTSGFSNSNIANLTNTNKLPFILSVACVNGNFTNNTTCFAEAWLRAGTPSAPTGAIATVMSTINQYWDEPMAGQDHMVDVLATTTVSIKRSFAGIAMNGCMHMNDVYGATGGDMTDTWTVFGDPSLRVTTAPTTSMTVTHPASVNLGTSNINVNSNENGALICFNVLGNILSTGKINSGIVNMTFPALTTTDTIFVTGTAFNKNPYFGKIIVNALSTGLNELKSKEGMEIYPVPSNGILNLKLANYSGIYTYEIYNVIGQNVKTSAIKTALNGLNEQIDIHNIPAGTYVIRLNTGSEIKQMKFIKE